MAKKEENFSVKSVFGKAKNYVGNLRAEAKKVKTEKQKELEKKKALAKEVKASKTDVQNINLTMSSVAKATLVVIFLFWLVGVVVEIQSTIYLFLLAMFVMVALSPFVDFLEKYRVPRWLAILVIYALAFILVITMGILIGTLLADQMPSLIKSLAQSVSDIAISFLAFIKAIAKGEITFPFSEQVTPIANDIVNSIDPNQLYSEISNALGQIWSSFSSATGNIVSFTITAFSTIVGGIVGALVFFIITFFMILDKNTMSHFAYSILPLKYGNYATERAGMIQKKISAWMKGQIIICILIGTLIYLGLSILGVNYAFTLGIFAAFCELIPYVGPFIAAIPAVLIGLNQDGFMFAIWIAIFCLVIQTIEGNILVPIIMEKSVGLSPVLIMFILMVGFQFFGIIGMILAVPITTSLQIFVKDYQYNLREREKLKK